MNKDQRRRFDLDQAIEADLRQIETEAGPLTPKLRQAIRWAAQRAATREVFAVADLLRERADGLDEYAAKCADW